MTGQHTSSFLGSPEEWLRCKLELDQFHGLYGGNQVHLLGSGVGAVRAMAGNMERRFPLDVGLAGARAVFELAVEIGFLELAVDPRPGVPDETSYGLALTNASGERHALRKWARDSNPPFERLRAALNELAKETSKTAEYQGQIDRKWKLV
ncbi:MAG: hypothetical protein DRJ42_08085 [Deltaproteobacteria bacterium]|nr:MAG: hypothetical protein DRJ42_08085 [Deltaproteobacteria bacterium]